jgi:glycosyltransferase involved in cell wall biosynthesis
VEGLACYLFANKHDVNLAYSDVRGSTALYQLVDLIRARGGRCLNLAVSNAPEARDFGALRKLRSFARSIEPDVIHSHSSKAGALGRALALLGVRGRYFYTPNAYYGLNSRSGFRSGLFNLTERALGMIGTTINVSHDEAAFAREKLRISPRRIRVIHNPVDTARFTPADATRRIRARSQLGLAQDAIVLGAIGRISFQKDPHTLYRALVESFRAEPRLLLCHVGQGEMEKDIVELTCALQVERRVVRHAYLEQPICFYDAVDAVIMTSRYEGLPMTVLESMACDLPLILSDAPGMGDILAAGLSHCWSAPVEDVAAFGAAICAWLSDIPLRRPRNHRQIVRARFTMEQCYGAVVAAYREGQ